MKKYGYELEFSAVVRIVLTDPSPSLSDGFFYIKSFTFNEGEPTVISTFSQDKDTAKLDRSTVLAVFGRKGFRLAGTRKMRKAIRGKSRLVEGIADCRTNKFP